MLVWKLSLFCTKIIPIFWFNFSPVFLPNRQGGKWQSVSERTNPCLLIPRLLFKVQCGYTSYPHFPYRSYPIFHTILTPIFHTISSNFLPPFFISLLSSFSIHSYHSIPFSIPFLPPIWRQAYPFLSPAPIPPAMCICHQGLSPV